MPSDRQTTLWRALALTSARGLRVLRMGTALFAISTAAPAQERDRGAPDLLLRRFDGRYEGLSLPSPRGLEQRLEVRPIPGTDRSAVYGRDGRRLGTVESKPYGGYGFYDRQGRRR